MTRLAYAGWIITGLLLFTAALVFVLANPQSVTLTLLVPDLHFDISLGSLVLLVFLAGTLVGLVAGLGLRFWRRMAQGRA